MELIKKSGGAHYGMPTTKSTNLLPIGKMATLTSLIVPPVTMASHGGVPVSAAFQRPVRCLDFS